MGGFDKLFSGMRASASGLAAERTRIDVVARNIANSQTTSTSNGDGPYRRQVVHFEPILERLTNGEVVEAGVRVARVTADYRSPFESIHDPTHPDADVDGNVLLPNVNATKEMADLITALRAYEANLSVQENFIRMAERALRMI